MLEGGRESWLQGWVTRVETFYIQKERKLVLRALGAEQPASLDSGRWWHGPALVVKIHEVVHL